VASPTFPQQEKDFSAQVQDLANPTHWSTDIKSEKGYLKMKEIILNEIFVRSGGTWWTYWVARGLLAAMGLSYPGYVL
jgi:hypothetical protein